MDNVLIDRSASGFDFRRRAGGHGDARLSLAMSLPPRPPRAARGARGSFPYHAAAPPPPPFQYAPALYHLHSSLSLPPPPPRRAPLPPLPPAAAMAKYTATPVVPAAARIRAGAAEYKRKKPRAPRLAADEPPRAQRRKPLERAAPLPPALAVVEALDDLEREAARGFAEDLTHALAPPPSSLPLPTFSLVRAAAAKAAAASCAV